jgi:hypothetical protein
MPRLLLFAPCSKVIVSADGQTVTLVALVAGVNAPQGATVADLTWEHLTVWQAGPGETVQLRATASAAYKALQPVKLTIYRSDQTPVKTMETTTSVSPGVTELPFTWDGFQDDPQAGIAEPGVYLFQWRVGEAGPAMDADQDKSGTQITATVLDYDYAGDKWLSDATIQGSSEWSRTRVFAPNLALVAAEQATDSIKNNMRAVAVLMGSSPFVLNEQELPWQVRGPERSVRNAVPRFDPRRRTLVGMPDNCRRPDLPPATLRRPQLDPL